MRRRIEVEPEARAEVITGYTFDEAGLTTRSARRWPGDKLHIMLSRKDMGEAARSILQAELKRREAWRSPAGLSFWLSCAALLVSFGSLVVSAI